MISKKIVKKFMPTISFSWSSEYFLLLAIGGPITDFGIDIQIGKLCIDVMWD